MEEILESFYIKTLIADKNLPSPGVMLMLHGWGQTHRFFEPLGQMYHSMQNYTVLLMDLAGHGQAPAPKEIWDSSTYSREIIAILEKKELKELILWGHSFGGKVALHIAYQRPELIQNLILMGASGLPRLRSFKEKMRFSGIKYLGKSLKLIEKMTPYRPWQDWFSPKYASIDYQRATGIMKKVLVKTIHEDLSELAKNFHQKTGKGGRVILVWGQRDSETPVNMGERFAAYIPDSKLIVIPNRGHMILEYLSHHLIMQLVQL